jgi:hypothetical protein
MKPQPSPHEQEHLAVQELLPWHVAGTLSAGEQAMVAQHLASCAACRADVALERHVLAAEREPAPPLPAGLDPEAALARLMPRLDEVPGAAHAAPAAPAVAATNAAHAAPARGAPATASGAASLLRLLQRAAGAFNGGGWRNWALAAQLAVIVGLGALLAPPGDGPDPAYRALGSGTAATPDMVVMFQPDARLDHVQLLLQASGARIVDGPTVTGAYLIDVDAARMPQLLAALRADPGVRLAEPLGAGVRP